MTKDEAILKLAGIIGKKHGETTPCVICKKIAEEIYEAGYRIVPELKGLSPDEISDVLESVQPEGFNWSNLTPAEVVKFVAVAQAQVDDVMRQIEGK